MYGCEGVDQTTKMKMMFADWDTGRHTHHDESEGQEKKRADLPRWSIMNKRGKRRNEGRICIVWRNATGGERERKRGGILCRSLVCWYLAQPRACFYLDASDVTDWLSE